MGNAQPECRETASWTALDSAEPQSPTPGRSSSPGKKLWRKLSQKNNWPFKVRAAQGEGAGEYKSRKSNNDDDSNEKVFISPPRLVAQTASVSSSHLPLSKICLHPHESRQPRRSSMESPNETQQTPDCTLFEEDLAVETSSAKFLRRHSASRVNMRSTSHDDVFVSSRIMRSHSLSRHVSSSISEIDFSSWNKFKNSCSGEEPNRPAPRPPAQPPLPRRLPKAASSRSAAFVQQSCRKG